MKHVALFGLVLALVACGGGAAPHNRAQFSKIRSRNSLWTTWNWTCPPARERLPLSRKAAQHRS